ncbi:MAG: hypothetical protein DRN21_02805 [Thermoplasmata archaeon]|nr:MAG: hypothetical protein DRN21_02805 [Thermoplasmata archaeon]HDN50760.1 hypothetical protein [Thermoplasmatales archaeon]
MEMKLLASALGIWFLFVVLAIINGVIRNGVYAPRIGEWEGHVVSTIIAICYTFLVVFIFLRYVPVAYTKTDLILIGVLWLSMTVAFEFLFGHYVAGHSWERLLADYNILEGRIWSLFLLTILLSPYVIGTLLKK